MPPRPARGSAGRRARAPTRCQGCVRGDDENGICTCDSVSSELPSVSDPSAPSARANRRASRKDFSGSSKEAGPLLVTSATTTRLPSMNGVDARSARRSKETSNHSSRLVGLGIAAAKHQQAVVGQDRPSAASRGARRRSARRIRTASRYPAGSRSAPRSTTSVNSPRSSGRVGRGGRPHRRACLTRRPPSRHGCRH